MMRSTTSALSDMTSVLERVSMIAVPPGVKLPMLGFDKNTAFKTSSMAA